MPSFLQRIRAWGAVGPRGRQVFGVVALGVLLLGAGAYLWQRHVQSMWLAQRGQLQGAMDLDTATAYRQVVQVGCALLQQHPGAQDVGAKVAYAATILAVEHQDGPMLALSRRRIAANNLAAGIDPNDATSLGGITGPEGNAVAARLLALYGGGELTGGMALACAVANSGPGRVMAKLEALRLMGAAKAEGPATAQLAQALVADVTDEARALVYLGMTALAQLNTAQAGAYFARALQRSPEHPQARLGAVWVPLFARQPSRAERWAAQRQAGEVLRLPPAALTPPIEAMALLVRAWAAELEGDGPAAQRDRAEALQLAPDHLLHEVAHEGPGRF